MYIEFNITLKFFNIIKLQFNMDHLLYITLNYINYECMYVLL